MSARACRHAALDREWRDRQMVRILDDMVWPTKKPEARERLRRLLGPTDGDRATVTRRRRYADALFALDNKVGWNGEKELSRSSAAMDAKRHLVEFHVCSSLRDEIAVDAEANADDECLERCERGAILVARMLDDELNDARLDDPVRDTLDRLGAEFRRRICASGAFDAADLVKGMVARPLPAIEILNGLLFGDSDTAVESVQHDLSSESGHRPHANLMNPSFVMPQSGGLRFRGNAANYYEKENSSLAEVLRRRKGIPITMTIIYSAVARRAGLRVQHVNAPSHFLCMVRPTGNASSEVVHLIDVFNGGVVHSHLQSSLNLLNARLLQPPSARDVCIRVLVNLQILLAECARVENVRTITEVKPLQFVLFSAMTSLRPEASLCRERLKLALEFGYVADAMEDLRAGLLLQRAFESKNIYEKRLKDYVDRRMDAMLLNLMPKKRGKSEDRSSEENPDGLYPVGTIITHPQVPGCNSSSRNGKVFVIHSRGIHQAGHLEGSAAEGTFDPTAEDMYGVDPLSDVGTFMSYHLGGPDKRNGCRNNPYHILRDPNETSQDGNVYLFPHSTIAKAEVTPDVTNIIRHCLSSRDCIRWLGTRFESFDENRGVFVPNAYYKWIDEGTDGEIAKDADMYDSSS